MVGLALARAKKSHFRFLAACGMAVAAVALACTPPRALAGQRCIFSDDCERGLICAGGWCRVECRTDRDCTNMFRCVPAPVANKRVCVPPESPSFCVLHSDCIPAGCDTDAGCSPTLLCAADNVCRQHCREDVDCRAYHPDGRCNVSTGACTFPWDGDGGTGP